MSRARELVEQLGLQPHPERGHYVETYRAERAVDTPAGARAASTAIYFLLTAAEGATHLHRLRSDELFHLYEGGPLRVALVGPAPDDRGRVAVLGRELAAGERPQLVIPAGTWFATELPPGVEYCLWGCTVAPGFSFEDFELGEPGELAGRYPAAAALLRRFPSRGTGGVRGGTSG
jgi:predicted cupin superfamily sugar epimerase